MIKTNYHIHTINSFTVLFFVVTVNLAQANTETNTMDLIKTTMNSFSEIRRLFLCLARSCNPLAVAKAFEVDDMSEMKLKQKPYESETNMDRVLKLGSVLTGAMPVLLQIEPECSNPLYTCPKRKGRKPAVPSELFEFADLSEMIISSSVCITPQNVPAAVRVLGEAVAFVETNSDTMGTSTSRFLPPMEMIAAGLKDLCNPPKEPVPSDVISEDDITSTDLSSRLIKDESLSKIVNKILLFMPTKNDVDTKPYWMWLERRKA